MSLSSGPFYLDSERLRLRELEFSDFDAVQRYATDPLVVEHLPFGPNTPEDTEAYLRRAMDAAEAIPRRVYEVAVTDRATGALIGGVRLGLERNWPSVETSYSRKSP